MKISKARLKEIIQEEVQLYKNENSSVVFEKYLDNDLKNLVQTATRDYELSKEQITAALTKALRELGSQEMNENRLESLLEYAEVKIEDLMNQLHDSGVPNEQLKSLLLKVVDNIDAGFVGEPS
tara:strand:+ start:5052 stop:5423 length:372 start_codon:yes stop_codon:yes gene_type:complete